MTLSRKLTVSNNRSTSIEIRHIPEPLLEFGFGQKLEYTRDGLYLYGPPSNVALVSQIRYGVIGTSQGVQRFLTWSRMVSKYIDIPAQTARSKRIQPQHIPFPGFEQAFGAKWSENPVVTISNIDSSKLRNALNIGNRHEAIKLAVEIYLFPLIAEQNRLENPPDFWFVVVPEELYKLGLPKSKVDKVSRIPGQVKISAARALELKVQPTLFGDEEMEAEVYEYAANFRRQLKARLLRDRIVTQIVRETTLTPQDFLNQSGQPLRQLEDKATIAWKLCTSTYYKAGGLPWQLADVRPGVCYVGLVFKNTDQLSENCNACCAAQMFLTDGEGVVFRGALGPWYSPRTKQYHLDKQSARSLIEMVVKEYKRLHDENPPAELFIHARSYFKDCEWDGFEEGCPPATRLVGVQIRDAYDDLKLFRTGQYPVIRGTAAILSERNAYLWTSGYVPRLNTYMGPETPNPIQVKVQKGECELETVLLDVLGLTKINFNSCQFNNRLPVTIKFANDVGDVLISAPIDSEPKLPFKFYI